MVTDAVPSVFRFAVYGPPESINGETASRSSTVIISAVVPGYCSSLAFRALLIALPPDSGYKPSRKAVRFSVLVGGAGIILIV